jgi:2-phospho-L-lactate guanylyltransferase (CobY/MobA/RfbA family)
VTGRRVAVLEPVDTQPPVGIESEDYRLALLEDTYEVIAGLELVEAALAVDPAKQETARSLAWPGTEILGVPSVSQHTRTRATLDALAALGAESVAVVAGDAPDLPGLLIGKLFRALSPADAAVCPAAAGGLVALATKVPRADWLPDVDLDDEDALDRLRAAAPRRHAVGVAPGWHRLRAPVDVHRLDPGLEGWESTRALLSGAAR